MTLFKEYKKYFDNIMNQVITTQEENINQGARLIAESVLNGGRLYTFGTGHSHMIAEELYNRAGGFALVTAILPTELLLHERPNKSTSFERVEGLAKLYLDMYQLTSKDVLMVISNSGRNAVPVEMCVEARKSGIKVIALTNLAHSKSVTSRHKSGKRMFEVSDVVIDNCGTIGDAGFKIPNSEIYSGPTSSSIGCFLAQALIVETLDILVKHNFNPPVLKSSNLDNADKYNEEIFNRYLKW
jgi:uncharacterized phosphosugar-binding protein